MLEHTCKIHSDRLWHINQKGHHNTVKNFPFELQFSKYKLGLEGLF